MYDNVLYHTLNCSLREVACIRQNLGLLAAEIPRQRRRRSPAARRTTDTALTADAVYQLLKHYGLMAGISVQRFGPHAARATAAPNALDAGADIAKVQEWLGTLA
jgi:hypothetical protein